MYWLFSSECVFSTRLFSSSFFSSDRKLGKRGMYWVGAAVQTRVTDKGEGGLARSSGQEVEESYISRAEQTTPGKQKESRLEVKI